MWGGGAGGRQVCMKSIEESTTHWTPCWRCSHSPPQSLHRFTGHAQSLYSKTWLSQGCRCRPLKGTEGSQREIHHSTSEQITYNWPIRYVYSSEFVSYHLYRAFPSRELSFLLIGFLLENPHFLLYYLGQVYSFSSLIHFLKAPYPHPSGSLMCFHVQKCTIAGFKS